MAAPSKRNQLLLLGWSWVQIAIAAAALALIVRHDLLAGVLLMLAFCACVAFTIFYLRERLGFNRFGGWPEG